MRMSRDNARRQIQAQEEGKTDRKVRKQESQGGTEGGKELAGLLCLTEKTHWKRESVSGESILLLSKTTS